MSADPQIRYLGDVQRLVLNPGDIVVLNVDHEISDEMAARLREACESYIPGHKFLILGPGIKVGVMGREG